MFISSKGELTHIAVKWLQLIRKNGTDKQDNSKKNVVRIEESLPLAEKILNGPFSRLLRHEGKDSITTNAVNGKLNGVAFAWKKIEAENGTMVLTPCYSYVFRNYL